MKYQRYEILAPVGNTEMFEAALASGADAVYLAGTKFGARNLTHKFELEDISKLVERAHIHRVKVYITVNTLIKDSEMEEFYEYLSGLMEAKIDALIVQDFGVYQLIRKYYPEIEIHASTQMAVNTLLSAKHIEKLGFSRVVVGRETAISEIEKIRDNTSLEIEAFVHGALCVCISGRCLMSSLIGGRSGNRGKCAQPCRKTFDIFDIDRKRISKLSDTFISSKDLCLIDDVDDMLKSGVYSFKIEGRLKKPEYVYQVVKEYKNALSNHRYSKGNLSLVSNRSFTKGLAKGDFGRQYYNPKNEVSGMPVGHIEKNKKIFLVLSERVFKKDIISFENEKNQRFNLTMTDNYDVNSRIDLSKYSDIKADSTAFKIFSDQIRENLNSDKKRKKFNIKVKIYARKNEELKMEFSESDLIGEIKSDFIVQASEKTSTSESEISQRISKLGNTPYEIASMEIETDKDIFIPASVLNNLKRDMINEIEKNYLQVDKVTQNSYIAIKQNNVFRGVKLSLEVFGKINWNIDLEVFSRIYIHSFDELEKLREVYSKEIFYVSKRIMIQEEYDKLEKTIDKYIDLIDGFGINDIGEIDFYSKYNKKYHIENHLNIFNSEAIEFFNNKGIMDYSLSEELNFEEINLLKTGKDEVEIIGYGKLPTMIMKHCPASPIKNCKDSKNCESCRFNHIYMENEFDKFEVIRSAEYSEILTSKPKNILPKMEEIKKSNISRVRIIDREDGDIEKIVNKFVSSIKGKRYRENTYLGHLDKGVQ
ncbi:MAG: DUF3656 domain-containing protein [Tissierellia bacterium]|nr:DUF3656 domain-containing protein [Tissierellia bacterium]